MKIINNNMNINIASYGKDMENKAKVNIQKGAKGQATVKEEKVAISPKAMQLNKASVAIKSVPEVREDKIARIKEQIENGTYEIDNKKIAENIINDILEIRSIKSSEK